MADHGALNVQRGDHLAQWRNATAKLSQLAPEEVDNSPMVVVIGQQSVGKSSILERLCKCPLWTGVRTTTLGPTRIESWGHGDQFKAEVFIKFDNPADGVPEGEVPFTQEPITDVTGLDKILCAAGNEAARASDGLGMGTYEQVGDSETAEGSFTRNLVVVRLSGPQQPNITVIDLPGLASEKGEHFLANLARTYFSKTRSLNVLCLIGCGPAPNSTWAEVKILKECDPQGHNTIGLVTKADLMQNVDVSEWGDLIANENDNFSSFQPKHGWWPIRLRSLDEKADGVPIEELQAIDKDLFATRAWTKLAERTKRSFGWDIVSNKIYSHYRTQVREHLPELRRRIHELLQRHTATLSLLPPEIGDAGVASLYHEVIPVIGRRLTEDINHNVMHEDDHFIMANMQHQFRKDLQAAIPEFLPMSKADSFPGHSGPEPYTGDWWPRKGEGKRRLLLDDIHLSLERTFNHRIREPQSRRAEKLCLTNLGINWRVICDAYNDAVWNLVRKMAENAVEEVCVNKPGARRIATDALIGLIAPFKAKAAQRLEWQCSRETDDDPEIVEYHDQSVFTQRTLALNHLLAQYGKWKGTRTPPSPLFGNSSLGMRSRPTPSTGNALPTPGPSRHGSQADVHSPTLSVPSLPVLDVAGIRVPPLDESHNQWTPEFLKHSIYLGVQVVLRVIDSARRLDITVGPDIQRLVQDYLQGVQYRLVQAFELTNVVPGTLKRARLAFEPDENTVLERERLKRLKTGLEELSQCLD